MTEQVSELISGTWRDAQSDDRMVFGCNHVDSVPSRDSSDTPTSNRTAEEKQQYSQKKCESVSSKQLFVSGGRKRRVLI
ncbi:unnamed protein product [Phytophthora fragariaefolia]|uniref:Unnamed protein product n=1 Tax=Phytophthora fragariaefolia TaxID=1490495 RepID=A0A9W6YBE9_9STRA|nr:unnamed protein product [Phytophthora fragariaefolia]